MAQALAQALAQLDDILSNFHAYEEISDAPQPTQVTAVKQAHTSSSARLQQNDYSQATEKKPSGKAEKKAAKQAKQPKEPAVSASLADTFAKARLVVGVVRSVEELDNSDKLYRCQVQVGAGEDDLIQIVAGLRLHVPRAEMEGRRVATILNLKTARLAGHASQGMILAAVQKGEEYSNGELVHPVCVPETSQPGDPIHLKGRDPLSAFPKEFRQWSKVLPQLRVHDHKAHFEECELETSTGPITADPSIPNGAAIS